MSEKMDESVTTAMGQPGMLSEACRLCMQCGLCCDGTLARRARVLDGDEFDYTDAWGVTTGRKGTGFPLPCTFLQNKVCLIYSCRPKICGQYKCRLLRRFENGEISFAETMQVIRQTVEHAAKVRAALEAVVNEKDAPLLRLYLRLKESIPLSPDNARIFLEFAALRVRLDRHFRKKGTPHDTSLTEGAPDIGIENG
jgi:hypothetical protein